MGVLNGKVAIVTGSGAGIGRATALLFAKEGARVVTNNRSPDSKNGSAASVAEEIKIAGGEAIPVFTDVASEEGGLLLVQTAIKTFGKLDIMVCNAGISTLSMIWDMTSDQWDSVIRAHLRGNFLCGRAAARVMKEQKSGCIINMSSRSGIYGRPGRSNYSAAKAGIIGLTLAMAQELEPFSVRVNTVCPSAITAMSSTRKDLFGYEAPAYLKNRPKMERPTEGVAPLLAYLASDASIKITGQIFYIGGGEIAIHSRMEPIRTLFKTSLWTVEEIGQALPAFLTK